jgi:hypothetical protein
MTRLFTSGFETGGLSEFNPMIGTIETAIARSGTYSTYLVSAGNLGVSLPARSELYVGFGFYPRVTTTNAGRVIVAVTSAVENIFSITSNANANLYDCRILGVINDTIDAPDLTQWHYIQVYVKIDSTVGEIVVKINGVSVFTFIGNTGTNNATLVTFGAAQASSVGFNIDDIVINDSLGSYNNSWTGQPKLIPAVVDGDGSITQLSRGGVDSGANWSQVSPVPASDTGYVYTGNSDEYDLYTVAETLASALPEGASIINLIVVTRGRVDGGAGSGCGVLKSGDTLFEGDPKVYSGTFATNNDCFPTDESNTPWTLARVNAVEIGPMAKDLE